MVVIQAGCNRFVDKISLDLASRLWTLFINPPQIRVHPMTYLWRKMPWFEWFFTGTLNKSDVAFRTDDLVGLIHLPVLIFHARDDAVVPFQLGEKLFKVGHGIL